MKKLLFLLITTLTLILFVSFGIEKPSVEREENELLEYYKPDVEQVSTKYYSRYDVNILLEQASSNYLSNVYNIPIYIVSPILRYSIMYNVPIHLSLAVAQVESSFSPEATNVNNNGSVDYGLFQLNNSYRTGWTRSDFFDINTNTEEGISYLSEMISYFDGDIISAIAAYNAGPYRVENNNIPESTQMYIVKILEAEDYFNIVLNDYISSEQSIVLNSERGIDG